MKPKQRSDIGPKVLVRFPPEIYEKLSTLAKREKRSRAAQVALFVERMMETAA